MFCRLGGTHGTQDVFNEICRINILRARVIDQKISVQNTANRLGAAKLVKSAQPAGLQHPGVPAGRLGPNSAFL